MLLSDRTWELKYTRDDGDLVRKFYVPALSSAVRYDRTTGYFGADSLELAAIGIEHLDLNNGRMRLIVGCTLNEPEVEAIEKGLSARDAAGEIIRFPDQATLGPGESKALQLLAWMVWKGLLEVKVALPCQPKTRKPIGGTPVFHEKAGIIEDKTGDRIAFTGSLNETRQGWMLNGETISVFTSWGPGLPWLDKEDEAFQMLWADKAERTLVVDLPTAVRDSLLQFLPPDDQLPDRIKALRESPEAPPEPSEAEPAAEPELPPVQPPAAPPPEPWAIIRTAAQEPVNGKWVGEATSPCTAWPHQRRAFLRMYGERSDHAARLLIADEVGLGKTIQAGLLLRQMWLAGRLSRARILAPASVVSQWQAELREKFALDWPVYDGDCLRRYDPATQTFRETKVSRLAWSSEPFVIMSSHLARRRDRRAELADAEPYDLVIVDEAHHARVSRSGNRTEPNTLMRLLNQLRDKTHGLVLLSATPLQTTALDLYDLLSVLGLPDGWNATTFPRYFEELGEAHLTAEMIERCAELFRATEREFGEVPEKAASELARDPKGEPLSRIATKTVLTALRGPSAIKRRALAPEHRRAAIRLMKAYTPISQLVSRHTRSLLRRYKAEGKLDAQIATRNVQDRFIQMSPAERDIYQQTEQLIADAYKAAGDAKKKAAIGFILTIYRKRLSSSFAAVSKSLKGRLERSQASADDLLSAEDELDEAPEEAESVEQTADQILTAERIQALIDEIATLPMDTKALQLAKEIKALDQNGYKQVMVFTGYTDTLDALRDWLAVETGREVICFTGRGGEVRQPDGKWRQVSRADIKRRFREGKGDILLCTDAAAEGLNFQFCGALINYDMPWNPMRVEQRIGRIDRLGQAFETIRIVNLHYADTIETHVYMALAQRIQLFTEMVGNLQPILSATSGRIAALALAGASMADVEAELAATPEPEPPAVDLDDSTSSLEPLPTEIHPPLGRAFLTSLLTQAGRLPPSFEVSALDPDSWRLAHPGMQAPLRVTTAPEFYDAHFDSVDFFTPGSLTFPG